MKKILDLRLRVERFAEIESELQVPRKELIFIDEHLYDLPSRVHERKNILFIQPMLSGRHLYRYLLPAVVLSEAGGAYVAITGLQEYDPKKQYQDIDSPILETELNWADIVVIPFTTQPLKKLYTDIREINPDIRIMFNVDFNYYLTPKSHPYSSMFNDDKVIKNIEENIFYSDITMFNNIKLKEYVEKKILEDRDKKFGKTATSSVQFRFHPFLIDPNTVLGNLENKTITPEPKPDNTLRIGIVATEFSWDDLNAFKKQLSDIQKTYGDSVEFVVMGFDGINEQGKSCFPAGFQFKHIGPCSIVHYFRQFYEQNFDAIFIPMRQNEFNETSSNYNQFLEAALFAVPVIVPNVYPFNGMEENNVDEYMFILEKKNDLTGIIADFMKDPRVMKQYGEAARQKVADSLVFNEINVHTINSTFDY